MEKKSDSASRRKKLYLRGCLTNGMGLLILYLIAKGLDVNLYAKIAIGVQYFVFFVHGLPFNSEKFYDLSGSLTHFSVVATSLYLNLDEVHPVKMFASIASFVWMIRLGSFLYARILRDKKDERFDKIKLVWWSFMGAWTIQADWVLLIQLPAVLLNTNPVHTEMLNEYQYAAMGGWILGFMIEVLADSQKSSFRKVPENRHKYITSGLWRYSRHPNYFGEIIMHTSLAALASLSSGLHYAWLSPLFTCFLLLKVSGVPMLEKAGMKKWGGDPAYVNYVMNTSCLIPWFPAGDASKKNA